jgi:hypothetical protein
MWKLHALLDYLSFHQWKLGLNGDSEKIFTANSGKVEDTAQCPLFKKFLDLALIFSDVLTCAYAHQVFIPSSSRAHKDE